MLLKLYINFFKHLKSSNEKNLKLQSRKYHRELQFSYKFHLHPTSYQIVIILQRFCPHHTTVSANSHSVLATLSHSRGHCNRSKGVFGYGLLKFNTHHINVPSNAWSTKCRLIACMSAQIRSNLRDESIKPN
jgi:hypothetical protein